VNAFSKLVKANVELRAGVDRWRNIDAKIFINIASHRFRNPARLAVPFDDFDENFRSLKNRRRKQIARRNRLTISH